MKNLPNLLIITLVNLLISSSSFAQSPEKMSYQAVVRNSDGLLLANRSVGIRIQILQSSEFGAAVYVETHTRPTNANGLVTLEIGGGSVVMGSFSGINWSAGPYFLKTEIDPGGGTSYSIIGTTQLLSVPYALQSKRVTTEADPVFTVSPAAGITGTNITNWNTAYGWGNHSGLYRPVSWVPSWTDVTAKPTEFPPSTHPHSAVDITSGTLPVARGGTGAASFTSGNVLIGSGTGAITTLSRSGIDTRTAFPSAAHTHGDITSDGRIGTTAARLVMTGLDGKLAAAGGTAPGQIMYWTASGWALIPPGSTGQVLTIVNGVPTWLGTGAGTNDVFNPATGKIWMDRNLGATRVATTSTDANAYGHLYQWGRGTDGHQSRTSGTTSTLSSSNTPGHGNFITVTTSPHDWRSPQNTNLWQGVSGVNNPCPAGYRLPTDAEWNAERLSWSSNNSAGAFATPLKLPVAGVRYSSNGSLYDVGSCGYYWSSSVEGTRSRALYFYSSSAGVNSDSRANGFSVRCLKD